MNCHDEANEDDYHSHEHGHGHGHGHSHDGHDHSHDEEADTGQADSLFDKVLVDQAWCLNESEPESIKLVFKPWHRRLDTTQLVSSDSDAELLVYVPFNGMVKLKSIFLWGGVGDEAPQSVRVFANRDDLDFDNVGDVQPTQEWTLARGARAPVEYPVRSAKFSSVRSLTLHLPRSFADEETMELYFLSFRGEWLPLTADPIISIYELTPNAADHKTPASELAGHHTIS
ncbi:hypothetical protein IW146_003241 [Coemansia sp. RSA 922]|nr:hypothetical protein H4S04_001406 [Coemansia sp. S16]KAJ2067511.1 hypothetical protein GGI08_001344 [Coemansia sp. S2]KAJ2114229.1 hypothetical protein IW146_003241 [Coemansia sp. RSA 922]